MQRKRMAFEWDVVIATAHLAERLHKGQVDKAGAAYFRGYLSEVATMGRTWHE